MVDTNAIKSELKTFKKQNTYINKLVDKEIKKLEEFKPNAKIKHDILQLNTLYFTTKK